MFLLPTAIHFQELRSRRAFQRTRRLSLLKGMPRTPNKPHLHLHSWTSRASQKILNCCKQLARRPTAMRSTIFVVALISLATFASASTGGCRYEPTQCSCKIGEENHGLCWNKVSDSNPLALQCFPRACQRGWTCSCDGRTHLCQVKTFNTLTNTGQSVTIKDVIAANAAPLPDRGSSVNFEEDQLRMLKLQTIRAKTKLTKASRQLLLDAASTDPNLRRSCVAKPVQAANLPYYRLASMMIGISRRGTEANQCTNLDVYVNGGLFVSHSPETTMAGKNVDNLLGARAHHTLMELRTGDLIAFHFKQA